MRAGIGDLFYAVARGTGIVVINASGGMHAIKLDAGESMIIDNENLVAWNDGLSISLRLAIQPKKRSKFAVMRAMGKVGRFAKSFLVGEGVMLNVKNGSDTPKYVYINTRSHGAIYQARRLDALTNEVRALHARCGAGFSEG